jgi:hypothetical protein
MMQHASLAQNTAEMSALQSIVQKYKVGSADLEVRGGEGEGAAGAALSGPTPACTHTHTHTTHTHTHTHTSPHRH